ncbi:P27 family phage terminase small subunit [Kutzneria kofuensis]|uniref:Phage terminase small subunit n=1 Tax=Kutzneria kofuensis TaxID=103725 RepID=A0A7W9KQ49_9PSEU|nr:P27 family phage terminase small subunit [Kutzneria kofuensis]MBB5896671.1 phage terminase small subunit [Kutzneria kofuensis]
MIWERLAPGLISCKVLTAWDAEAFLIMCEALARYRAATQLVNGSALLVQGGPG